MSKMTCIVSEQVATDMKSIDYMFREDPEDKNDSGWRFYSGQESLDYVDDEQNFGVFHLEDVKEMDPSIVAYLDAPVGSEFERIEGSEKFEKVTEE